MQKLILSIIALSAVLISNSAFSETLSIGYNIGKGKSNIVEDSCARIDDFYSRLRRLRGHEFTCDNNDTDSVSSINVRYFFSEKWGVEAGFMKLGEYNSYLKTDGSEVANRATAGNPAELFRFDVQGQYIAGLYQWSLADKWMAIGRLGVSRINVDIIKDTSVLFDEGVSNEVVAMAGAGVSYRVTKNWSVNVSYDYFDSDIISSTLTTGIRYHFPTGVTLR